MSKCILVKISIVCLVMFTLSITAFLQKTYALSDFFDSGKNFLDKGEPVEDYINTDQLKETSDTIHNTLFAIAIVIAVIVAMVLGIQFMWASADEKAKVKEAIIPFVVGCIVVFGSFDIWSTVVNIGKEAEEPKQKVEEASAVLTDRSEKACDYLYEVTIDNDENGGMSVEQLEEIYADMLIYYNTNGFETYQEEYECNRVRIALIKKRTPT